MPWEKPGPVPARPDREDTRAEDDGRIERRGRDTEDCGGERIERRDCDAEAFGDERIEWRDRDAEDCSGRRIDGREREAEDCGDERIEWRDRDAEDCSGRRIDGREREAEDCGNERIEWRDAERDTLGFEEREERAWGDVPRDDRSARADSASGSQMAAESKTIVRRRKMVRPIRRVMGELGMVPFSYFFQEAQGDSPMFWAKPYTDGVRYGQKPGPRDGTVPGFLVLQMGEWRAKRRHNLRRKRIEN